jgi:hypothetical protein
MFIWGKNMKGEKRKRVKCKKKEESGKINGKFKLKG